MDNYKVGVTDEYNELKDRYNKLHNEDGRMKQHRKEMVRHRGNVAIYNAHSHKLTINCENVSVVLNVRRKPTEGEMRGIIDNLLTKGVIEWDFGKL